MGLNCPVYLGSLAVRGKDKNGGGGVLFVGYLKKVNHLDVCGSSSRERERIPKYVGGVEFATTGEGISQKPEKEGHILWNERKAGADGGR